jgi:hydrogenase maturation factor HypE
VRLGHSLPAGVSTGNGPGFNAVGIAAIINIYALHMNHQEDRVSDYLKIEIDSLISIFRTDEGDDLVSTRVAKLRMHVEGRVPRKSSRKMIVANNDNYALAA